MISAKFLLVYLIGTASLVGIDNDTSKLDIDQTFCLAKNIFYEARNEDIQGQFAVASVTINRMNDLRFPDTVCEVVQQTSISRITRRVICAFSWYCENRKKSNDIPITNRDGSINKEVMDQFRLASIVAIATLTGDVKDNTQGATHFHNPDISKPSWSNKLQKTIKLGNHIFYR